MAAKRSILERRMKWLAAEEQNRPWLVEMWQPFLLLVWALLLWGVVNGLAGSGRGRPEIDYTAFFHGRAEYLGDRFVRLTYDFEPTDDPSNLFPQAQDWNRKKSIAGGWLPDGSSLNVAFENRVSVSCRFKIRKGSGIMPAIGVRGRKKLSFIAIQIDRNGRVAVGKYLEGDYEHGFATRAPFSFGLNEEHHLRIEAQEVAEVYDPEAEREAERERELEMHPEVLGDEPAVVPEEEPGGAEALPADTAPRDSRPAKLPAVHLTVWLDGYRILDYTVLKYELKGWIAFMSWGGNEAFYDDVVVEGRLFGDWIVKELRMQQILSQGTHRSRTENAQ